MIQSLLVKAAWAIALRLLQSAALEELLMWVLNAAAASTKTDVDDKLVAVIGKYIGPGKEEVTPNAPSAS